MSRPSPSDAGPARAIHPASTDARATEPRGAVASTSVDEPMPDPDNLRIDRFSLPIPPRTLRPAPAIGERLSPPRHRAGATRSS